MPPHGLKPFQLLEINVISAQDLEPVSRKMKTYSTAWVHPRRKLTTRVDSGSHVNPTWNDKFVFRVDEEFLSQDTSAVQIEIYAVQWFKDTLVGSVRVLVGNLIPPALLSRQSHIGMRFVALQVRRPSGRPQGILNIGVTLLDSSMRSMPLYTQPTTSAVGYKDLMGEEDAYLQNQNNNSFQNYGVGALHNHGVAAPPSVKPILRRTRSERSEFVALDDQSAAGSMVAIPTMIKKSSILEKDNSIISISNEPFKGFPKKGKASSVISGAELRERKPRNRGHMRKASSVLGSSTETTFIQLQEYDSSPTDGKTENSVSDPKNNKGIVDNKNVTISKPISPPKMAVGRPAPGKYVVGAPYKANSIWSDSEVGPSPSEVAAAMAERRYPLEEERSSVLDGWSLNESVEGLRSKLERWRTELPPLYDRGYSSSSFRSTGTQKRKNTEEGGKTGMFSCFGNIYGYECQCICGKPPGKKANRAKYQSPSEASRSFL